MEKGILAMSLANIPFFKLLKPVAALGSDAVSSDQNIINDQFFDILTAPQNSMPQEKVSITHDNHAILATRSGVEPEEGPQDIVAFLSQLKNAAASEQAELLLQKAHEFGGLDKLVAEFEKNFLNPSSSPHAQDENGFQNQKFSSFLSLVAEFREGNPSEPPKANNDTTVLAKQDDKAQSIDKHLVAPQLPELPKFSRTANLVLPISHKASAIAVKDLPPEVALPPTLLNAVPSNDQTNPQSFDHADTKTQSRTASDSLKESKQIPGFSHQLSNGKTQINLAPQASDHKIASESSLNIVQSSTQKHSDIKETKTEIASLKTQGEGLRAPERAENVGVRNTFSNRFVSNVLNQKEKAKAEIQTAQSKELTGKLSHREQTAKAEIQTPSIKEPTRYLSHREQTANAEVQTTLRKELIPNSGPKEQKPENRPQQSISYRKTLENAFESKVLDSTSPKANQEIKSEPKIISDSQRVNTFTVETFRISLAEIKGQSIGQTKAKSKGKVENSAITDTVVKSFSRAIDTSIETPLQRTLEKKSVVENFSFDLTMYRSNNAHISSAATNSNILPSLENLEKWIDSHLDLNSRGWVTKLSKSILSALSSGQQRLTFMLSPESLGKINVSFVNNISGLDIKISTERQATAALIGDSEAKLVSSIEVTGQRVSSLSCSSSNSFEQGYNSHQSASSNTNRENSEKRNESQKREAENRFDNNEPTETIGKSTDDDTIVNITI